jgi:hypothetical protein
VCDGEEEIIEVQLHQAVDFVLSLASDVVVLTLQGCVDDPLDLVHLSNYHLKRPPL